ncbi:MAG: M20/M25/M40 family metallo-hydrolase [Culicoidibacterales bacterium]
MVNTNRAVEHFMKLVQIDSVSLNEREMADYLLSYFSTLGYECYEDIKSMKAVKGATAGNVIVKVPGTLKKPVIMLCAHMDTVEPGNGIIPVISTDGKYVISQGDTILGADDKSGIAQIIELIHILSEQKLEHPPLELVFPICEEIGLLGAENLDMENIESKFVYVLDGGPGPGDAIIGGPDYYDVIGRVIGKAAHAGGAPEKGISSIQVVAHAIANMNLLKIDEETTTNVGSVICNYPLNVVPEITTFGIEVRSLDSEKGKRQLKHVTNCLENAVAKFGATLELTVNKSLHAYKLTDQNPALQHFKSVCNRHGIPVNTIVSRGGTDLSALAGHGLEGIVIASGGEFAHELQERLDIANFKACIEQLVYLVTE